MNDTEGTPGETGLLFFGKMTASISHEIKNVLAIINENAGMLEDFTFMERKGIPLNSETIGSVAKRMLKQIQRADGIIKKMNRFAHSIDQPIATVDVVEAVALVIALCDRIAANKTITLEAAPSSIPVTIVTSPFYLETLIWRCIEFSMEVSGKDKRVAIAVEPDERGARIRFTLLGGLGQNQPQPERFPAKAENALLEALKAGLAVDIAAHEIVMVLPNLVSDGSNP